MASKSAQDERGSSLTSKSTTSFYFLVLMSDSSYSRLLLELFNNYNVPKKNNNDQQSVMVLQFGNKKALSGTNTIPLTKTRAYFSFFRDKEHCDACTWLKAT